MMWRHSSCAGETQLQQASAAVRTMWERVGHRSGTAGLETAWTSEILRRILHGRRFTVVDLVVVWLSQMLLNRGRACVP